tara:strand:- start:151 stop:348 length:198 start_codon:yes stop_codon:yes gene_type:complete
MSTTPNFIGQSGEQTSFDAIVRQNLQTVSSSLTVDASNNAMSAGPITIASSVTVEVADGATWTVV